MSTISMQAQIQTNAGVQYLQCMPKDMSTDFSDLSNTYFLADSLVLFLSVLRRSCFAVCGQPFAAAAVQIDGIDRGMMRHRILRNR